MISISIVRQQPRVLGLVVNLATRRSVFIPILRVAAIEPGAVTLNTGNVSLRHFEMVITGLGIEQSRTRDWVVSRIAVRSQRRLGRRGPVHVVDWRNAQGLIPSALALPDPGVAQLLDGQRAVDVADAVRGLPPKRRYEVLKAFNDARLADILQELPQHDQADTLSHLGNERSADVLEEMDPDDAADLLRALNPTDAEMLLTRMDPGDSGQLRRLLEHSPDTARGLMTPDPVVLTPHTSVAEALARDLCEPARGDGALGPIPVYPAQLGILRADQGRHRTLGVRAGRIAAGGRRGRHARVFASRTGRFANDAGPSTAANPRCRVGPGGQRTGPAR